MSERNQKRDIQDQQKLNAFLDRNLTIPVMIHHMGELSKDNKNYDVIRDIEKTGFSFTIRELLHAIGNKLPSLPKYINDNCKIEVLFFLHNLDLNAKTLKFRKETPAEHDLLPSYINRIGVGFTCLFASKFFDIHSHELQPIPVGPGKRFDYRGVKGSVKAIFEAKGTTKKQYRSRQIRKALEQKKAYHERQEFFDIELIVCSHVGFEEGEEPSIMIADPELSFKELAFSPHMEIFYRYRHFARVMQFIGLPKYARQIYLDSEYIRKKRKFRSLRKLKKPEGMDILKIGGDSFVGRWFKRWIPLDSKRYKHLISKEIWSEEDEYRVSVYQGLHMRIYENLSKKNLLDVKPTIFEEAIPHEDLTDDGNKASIFSDGTVMVFKLMKS